MELLKKQNPNSTLLSIDEDRQKDEQREFGYTVTSSMNFNMKMS